MKKVNVKRRISKVSPMDQIRMFNNSKTIFSRMGAEVATAISEQGVAIDFGFPGMDAKYVKPELVGEIQFIKDKMVFTLNHNPANSISNDDNCIGSLISVSPSGATSADITKYTVRKSGSEFVVASKLLSEIYPLPVTGSAEFLKWEFELPEEVYFAMLSLK